MARSASGPSAETRSAGSAWRRREGEGIAAPSPPKHRPSRPPRSSTPKCRRAGVSTKTLARLDIVGQQCHRFLFPRPSGLVYDDLKSGVLLPDLLRRQKMGPGGENGRLQHRMSGPVEADELTLEAAMDHPRLDAGAGRRGIESDHLELSPGTRRLKHGSGHHDRGLRRKLRTRDSPLSKEHGVVGQIHDRSAAGPQVPEGGSLEKGL